VVDTCLRSDSALFGYIIAKSCQNIFTVAKVRWQSQMPLFVWTVYTNIREMSASHFRRPAVYVHVVSCMCLLLIIGSGCKRFFSRDLLNPL